MNISVMTEEEKSYHLVTLCDWQPAEIKGYGSCWVDGDYEPILRVAGFPLAITPPNLYKEENMALAWRVLNWAWLYLPSPDTFVSWWYERGEVMTHCHLPAIAPAAAMSAWLDEILRIATEAGMTGIIP